MVRFAHRIWMQVHGFCSHVHASCREVLACLALGLESMYVRGDCFSVVAFVHHNADLQPPRLLRASCVDALSIPRGLKSAAVVPPSGRTDT